MNTEISECFAIWWEHEIGLEFCAWVVFLESGFKWCDVSSVLLWDMRVHTQLLVDLEKGTKERYRSLMFSLKPWEIKGPQNLCKSCVKCVPQADDKNWSSLNGTPEYISHCVKSPLKILCSMVLKSIQTKN